MSKIEWKYFFGWHADEGNRFARHYFSEINGIRLEKKSTHRKTEYCVGNIDEAKTKYKTEEELLKFINQ